MDPTFLSLEEVLSLHGDQIRRYGGSEGLRDAGLLSSALAAPRSTFGGELLHPTLFDQAAAYLFHLAKNHPFIDGNKRVALAAALLFLWMNGVEVDTDEDELTDLVLGVAEGRVTKPEVSAFLERNARA